MRSNLGVTADNMNSPPPPELIPPLHIFSPWLFEVTLQAFISHHYQDERFLSQVHCQIKYDQYMVIHDIYTNSSPHEFT